MMRPSSPSCSPRTRVGRRSCRPAAPAVALAAAGLLAALGAAGCVGYGSSQVVEDGTVFDNPNTPGVHAVMGVGVRWVSNRYPPRDEWGLSPGRAMSPADAEFAVSVPEGTRRSIYLSIVEQAGEGAAPLTPATDHLPTYYVAGARVMGDTAQVDIYRPVLELGPGPEGRPVHQAVTVHLRGGLRPWRVVAHKVWTLGAFPTPEPFYLPADEEYAPPTPGPDYSLPPSPARPRSTPPPPADPEHGLQPEDIPYDPEARAPGADPELESDAAAGGDTNPPRL